MFKTKWQILNLLYLRHSHAVANIYRISRVKILTRQGGSYFDIIYVGFAMLFYYITIVKSMKDRKLLLKDYSSPFFIE